MIVKKINGIDVLYTKHSSKITNIQIYTKVGSSKEKQNEHGISHFLEHMIFKGTLKRDAKKINQDSDLLGAKLNAWTWYDYTNYHISVLDQHFEEGFELLSDIYLNSQFPEGEIEKEKSVIHSEIRRYDDDPASYLGDRSIHHFCKNGTAHKITGEVDDVQSFTREQLLQFKQRYYGGDHVLISIVAPFEFETVEKIINKYFKPLNNVDDSITSSTDYAYGDYVLRKKDVQEAQYQLYYPALDYNDPDAQAQSVLIYCLGGNPSSYLYERIREECGLCYSIYARTNRFESFNYIEVISSCSHDDINILHDEVIKIIDHLKNNSISEKHLEMAKSSMLSSLYMSTESSNGLNNFLSMNYLKGERGDILKKRVEAIQSITLKDLNRVCDKTFSSQFLKCILTK